MRVIGVVDILHGRAVLARAGERAHYAPVSQFAGQPLVPGDVCELAAAYLGSAVHELYAADLDAIQGRPVNAAVLTRLVSLGAPLWIDAGVQDLRGAREVLAVGEVRVVAGLETVPDPALLHQLRRVTPAGALAFSLDLRNGEPVLSRESGWSRDGMGPVEIVRAAVDAGVDAIIVLDLARVGMGRGVDLPLLAAVRGAAPGVDLLAGGGVRGPSDLEALASVGCDGALVATAIQDGRVTASDIVSAHRSCAPSGRAAQ